MNHATLARFLDEIVPAFERGDPAVAGKPTERDNVRVILGQCQAIGRGDLAALEASMAEDVELEIVGPAEVPIVGRWCGRGAVLDAVGKNFRYFEDQRPEIVSVVAQGDTVALVVRERGAWRATGHRYDVHLTQVFTLASGKVTRVFELFDSGPILEAMREGR